MRIKQESNFHESFGCHGVCMITHFCCERWDIYFCLYLFRIFCNIMDIICKIATLMPRRIFGSLFYWFNFTFDLLLYHFLFVLLDIISLVRIMFPDFCGSINPSKLPLRVFFSYINVLIQTGFGTQSCCWVHNMVCTC